MDKVDLWSDGACHFNPGPGGWGVILLHKREDGQGIRHQKEFSGGEPHVTNNEMELQAVCEGLSRLKHPCDVTVYSDSQYVCQGINGWLAKWAANGYLLATKQPIKNLQLWQRLEGLMKIHQVTAQWVKGHSGVLLNERADQLAEQAVPRRKKGR